MNKKSSFPNNEKDFISCMNTSDGEIILNCIFTGQLVLTLRNNEFVALDMDGSSWNFQSFEQVCYFMVAAANSPYKERDIIKERTLELFPITAENNIKEEVAI